MSNSSTPASASASDAHVVAIGTTPARHGDAYIVSEVVSAIGVQLLVCSYWCARETARASETARANEAARANEGWSQ